MNKNHLKKNVFFFGRKTIQTILNAKLFEFGGNKVIFANIPTKAQVDENPSSYAVGTLYNDNGTLKIKIKES